MAFFHLFGPSLRLMQQVAHFILNQCDSKINQNQTKLICYCKSILYPGCAWGVPQKIKTRVRTENARPDLRLPLEGAAHHWRARLRVQLGHLEGLSSQPPGPGPGSWIPIKRKYLKLKARNSVNLAQIYDQNRRNTVKKQKKARRGQNGSGLPVEPSDKGLSGRLPQVPRQQKPDSEMLAYTGCFFHWASP